MSNYSVYHIEDSQRVELHDNLNLTGAEISINEMPAGGSVPFVHYHKQNEEIYLVLSGDGEIKLDNDTVKFSKGDAVRVSPQTKRQIFNTGKETLKYICIQVKENSLTQWTGEDAGM